MDMHDLLTIGEVAERSGFATSALRYYENAGLIHGHPHERAAAPIRAFVVLRRLAFICAARNIGLALEEVACGARPPAGRTHAQPRRLDEDVTGLAGVLR